ncbi:endoribonuclease Dicer-like [Daphnia carinata]|uniref:endoribonuclease Dicer-like n=1 Tax=Daphnia carinata TaxID=120202 RepID=UPI00257A3150|nr:endoribonuclease Dicer-like [Daphnia carinata]
MSNQQTEGSFENPCPRNYQLELYQYASRENTVVYLPTGSGKTMIAVLLIRDMAPQVKKPLTEGGRRIIFLVPTVILAKQQASYIRRHTCLEIGEYYGELGVDLWRGDRWTKELDKNNVLVMTAQLFVNAVHHGFIRIDSIALLVFDECHRAVKDSPMKQALTVVNETWESNGAKPAPRILGLTAALFLEKCKPRTVSKIIRQLKTNMKACIRTADPHKIEGYSTKPIEIICEYSLTNAEQSKTDWLLSEIHKLLDGCVVQLHKDLNKNAACPEELINIIREIKVLTTIFGPYGTNHTVSIFTKEIKRLGFQSVKVMQKGFFQLVLNVLEKIGNVCDQAFGSLSLLDRLRLFTTPHVTRLLDILRRFGPQPSGQYIPLCSIVFVDRRSSANVLYHILRAASKCDPELSYLTPLFTMGQASGKPKGKMKEANHLNQSQTQIIRGFRDGSCNLLVATSVLEEGVDVRACNLVVRFDGIKTYCDYVQSKGRARSPKAFYIMMVPENNLDDFLDTLSGFHSIEQSLHNPSSLTLSSVTEDEPVDRQIEEYWQTRIPYYCPVPNGPRITLLSSIGLINWYCASLPSGGSPTALLPYWTMLEIGLHNWRELDVKYVDHLRGTSSKFPLYQCRILLPLNAPLREELISKVMPSKRLARQEVALQACIRLHKLGELDDQHLLPLSKSIPIAEEDDDIHVNCDSNNPQENDFYPRGIASLFDQKLVPPYYLYLITYELVDSSDAVRQEDVFNPNFAERRLGFLTSQRLPPINPFGLFSPAGQFNVGFKEIDNHQQLSDVDVELCHRFQQFIFERILELTEDEQYNRETCSYLVVPMNSADNQIDLDFIRYQLDSSAPDWQCHLPGDKNFHQVYHDAVVIPQHDKAKEKSSYYYVNTICRNLTPLSPFPKQAFSTYFDYYRDRYGTQITNLQQSLLEVTKESLKSLNFLTPKYVNRKGASENDAKLKRIIHFIPELCHVHRFPASMWRQTVWIPSIFYRLNSLLLADELRIEIQNETGLGHELPFLHSGWEPLEIRTNSLDDVVKNIGNDFGTKIPLVREAAFGKQNGFSLDHSTPSDAIEDEIDLKHSLWNVDLFLSERNTNSMKAEKFKPNSNHHVNDEDPFTPTVKVQDVHFDDVFTKTSTGPSPGELLQALTTSVANAGFNLERLEVIGDSILKLATSIRIYCESPSNFHEGKMTLLRINQVCNANLFKLGKSKSIPRFMVATKFLPKENWLSPCYFPNNIDSDMESLVKPNGKLWQRIRKKTIADSVEALFGLYLAHHGIKGALKVMRWMGVNVPDPGEGSFSFGGSPPHPLLADFPQAENHLEDHLAGFDALERSINYTFRNRFYLLQAFSHASYHNNRMTSCYQRLEFLGDAVFDYLITKYLYETRLFQLTPGALSDMRSALVNNVTFAVLAVRNGFHRFLKHMVPNMHQSIDGFVQQQEMCDHAIPDEFTLVGTADDPMAEDTEVPKVLGDIFESLVGAVFLDSDMSLDVVWRIFYPFIRDEIEACTRTVPKSPIRKLHEKYPGKVEFKSLEKLPDGRVCVGVEIMNNGQLYKAVGRNTRIAKNTVAKYAISLLEN